MSGSGHSDIDDRAVDSHVDDANDRMDQDQDQDDAEAQIRNPYIDDSAVEAHEDDADDEMDDDEDDAEAQIRAADARDFPLRSTPDMPRPQTPPAASAALSMLASSAPSNLDLLASASALRERTPAFFFRTRSPASPPPSIHAIQVPFNVTSMARLPSPTTFEEAHADVSAPSTHSRPSSPDVERPAKRIRLHSQPLQLRRVRKFFDVHASDSEDGDNDDEEGSMHDSDIGYQDPNDESEVMKGAEMMMVQARIQSLGCTILNSSSLSVRPRRWLCRAPMPAALPIGTWFYDHSGPRNKALALVVSPTEQNYMTPRGYRQSVAFSVALARLLWSPADRVLIQDGPEPEGEGLDAGDSGWIIELRDFDLTNSIGTVFGQIPKAKVTALDYLPNEKNYRGSARALAQVVKAPPPCFGLLATAPSSRSVRWKMFVESFSMEMRSLSMPGSTKVVKGLSSLSSAGGALQIFDSAEPQPGEDIPQYQNFHVHSAHVNFLNERSPLGGQFSPTSGVIQRAAENNGFTEHCGSTFRGMFVRVVGNVLKNKAGMVVGDFDSPRRANRLDAARRANPAVAHNFRLSDFRGIMVTVREDKKNTTFTVNIKLLVKADGVALLRYDIQLSPD
ncbi:hypothetical protein B0H15DRAFT_806227 [Mycena belliarum]|uniref:Uncharacterized protein n=1 Tax=Mycena belliarum TaxID=1033014 RepID=A0AAD6TQE3_9AGAR|nr:hypothetical protein B0H15DRAFT_806227 [Mycena belliae]